MRISNMIQLQIGVILILLGYCLGDQWLMVGDFMTDELARERSVRLASTNSTTSVTSSLHLTLSTPPKHTINCVLAASLNMNGDVSLVDGGPGYENVTLAYRSLRSGRPDLFFVLVESFTDESTEIVEDHFERISIVYTPQRT